MLKLSDGRFMTSFGPMAIQTIRKLEALGVWKFLISDINWAETKKQKQTNENGKVEWVDVEVKKTKKNYDIAICMQEKSYEKINADDTVDQKNECLPFAYNNFQWYLHVSNGDIERAIKLLSFDPTVYLPAKEGFSSYSAMFRKMDEEKRRK